MKNDEDILGFGNKKSATGDGVAYTVIFDSDGEEQYKTNKVDLELIRNFVAPKTGWYAFSHNETKFLGEGDKYD